MSHPHFPVPGTVLGGKYRLVRVVGEGGMGVVYEAEHIRMRQRTAIKMLLPGTLGSPDVVARFEREARASAGLRSRHTARVTDVDQTADGLPYMVMEFLEGRDLGTLLDERHNLPVPEALDYVLQACVAIAEAHDAGIVHRDLKPSNLFLADGPDGAVIKLLDFGISKIVDDTAKLTSAESIMGTPLYMSPEQIRSARDVDGRADVWSLGVILYELLAGRTPFEGTTTQVAAAIVTDEIPPILTHHGVSPELQAVVLRALAKDRDARYPTTRDFAAALLAFAPPNCTGALAMEAALRQSQSPLSGAAPVSASLLAPAMPSRRSVEGPAPVPKPWRVLAFVAGGLLALSVVCAIALVSAAKIRAARDNPKVSGPSATGLEVSAAAVSVAPSAMAPPPIAAAESAPTSASPGDPPRDNAANTAPTMPTTPSAPTTPTAPSAKGPKRPDVKGSTAPPRAAAPSTPPSVASPPPSSDLPTHL